SALYIPLAKIILQKRLARRILPFTFAICVVLWLAWIDGVARMGVGRVIGAAMGFWLGAAVPVALVRKAYLTGVFVFHSCPNTNIRRAPVIHTTAASSSTNPSSPPARSADASMCFRPTFLAVHAARFRCLFGRENPS
ncbi:hypothetical protein C8F04DRAFT_361933, partial [Mycena alexandri]